MLLPSFRWIKIYILTLHCCEPLLVSFVLCFIRALISVICSRLTSNWLLKFRFAESWWCSGLGAKILCWARFQKWIHVQLCSNTMKLHVGRYRGFVGFWRITYWNCKEHTPVNTVSSSAKWTKYCFAFLQRTSTVVQFAEEHKLLCTFYRGIAPRPYWGHLFPRTPKIPLSNTDPPLRELHICIKRGPKK